MDFINDHTGVIRDPIGNTKFKWSMVANNKVKVEIEFLPKPSVYTIDNDQLISGDNSGFNFIRKKQP